MTDPDWKAELRRELDTAGRRASTRGTTRPLNRGRKIGVCLSLDGIETRGRGADDERGAVRRRYYGRSEELPDFRKSDGSSCVRQISSMVIDAGWPF